MKAFLDSRFENFLPPHPLLASSITGCWDSFSMIHGEASIWLASLVLRRELFVGVSRLK